MMENKFTSKIFDQAAEADTSADTSVDATVNATYAAIEADAKSGTPADSVKPGDLNDLDDERLVALAKSGDLEAEEHLIRKYKELVRSKSQFYYIIGADGDDVVQEGMIGLFKAIHSYNSDSTASFRTFADMCVDRQIISAIRTATRKKHEPLNESVSLSDPVSVTDTEMLNESGVTLMEIIRGNREMEPEQELMLKTLLEQISNNENNVFSTFELQVWERYSRGINYREIAAELGKSPKAVDNAIQRTKKKIMDSICR